jgi:hypothetical protein
VLLAIGIGYGLAKGLKAAMGSIGDTPQTESTEQEPSTKPEPKTPPTTDKGPKAKDKDKEPKEPK